MLVDKKGTRPFTVNAGGATEVKLDFDVPPAPSGEAAKPTVAPEAKAAAGASSGYAKGDVLDFCALAPKKNTGKFEKQRVVLFAPSEAGQVNDDGQIRDVDGARLVREVFAARFAMERFNNVVVSFPGKKGWEGQETLSLAEVRAFVKEARDEGDADHNARAEREKQFATYSLGCADYVAIPAITSHETKWEDQKVKTKDGEKTVKVLSFKMGAGLGIFRREGESFKRIALLSASVPSFVDTMTDVASASVPDVNIGGVDLLSAAAKVPDLPRYVSAVPDPQCLAGKAASEGVAGLASCGGKGEGTVEQALGGLDERLGSVCRKSRGSTASESERATLVVRCEVRARSFQLARALQKDSRKVDGWKLFGVLAHPETQPSFALGREEGVKIGAAFEVLDENHERIAYFKATQVGAGGDGGDKDHTLLRAHSGEAPAGARLDEYPQLGLVFTPYGSFGLLAMSSAKTRLVGGGKFSEFSLPTIVFGGGATVGYDLSALLHWTETYARIGAGVFAGSGVSTSAMLIPVDLWFEKGFFLARRLTLVTALGATVQRSSVTVKTTSTLPEERHFSSTMYGPAARLGLDVMLHPDWSLKLEGAARVPLNTASYSDDDGKVVPDWWASRADHFATIALNLGLAKTF